MPAMLAEEQGYPVAAAADEADDRELPRLKFQTQTSTLLNPMPNSTGKRLPRRLLLVAIWLNLPTNLLYKNLKSNRPVATPPLALTTSQDRSSTTSLASLEKELKTVARNQAAENGEVKSSARIWRRLDKAAWTVDTATIVAVEEVVEAVAGEDSTVAAAVVAIDHNTKLLPRINRVEAERLVVMHDCIFYYGWLDKSLISSIFSVGKHKLGGSVSPLYGMIESTELAFAHFLLPCSIFRYLCL